MGGERNISVGPAAVVAAISLALALVRRSRGFLLLGAGATAVELSPPYRAWLAAKARAGLEQAEAGESTPE